MLKCVTFGLDGVKIDFGPDVFTVRGDNEDIMIIYDKLQGMKTIPYELKKTGSQKVFRTPSKSCCSGCVDQDIEDNENILVYSCNLPKKEIWWNLGDNRVREFGRR